VVEIAAFIATNNALAPAIRASLFLLATRIRKNKMPKSKEQKRLEAAQRQQASEQKLAEQRAADRASDATAPAATPRVHIEPMTKPYLIQRGRIERPAKPLGAKFSEAVDLECMGSSEFEFGALAKALRALQAQAASLKLHKHPTIQDAKGNALFVLHGWGPADSDTYMGYLEKLRKGSLEIYTLEWTNFDLNATARNVDTDLWFDIDNNVIWSFDQKFMVNLRSHLQASWAYMDAQKAEYERDAATTS
jgi:hypothetical protein